VSTRELLIAALQRDGYSAESAARWADKAEDKSQRPDPLIRLRGVETVRTVSRNTMRLACLYRAKIVYKLAPGLT
jgi:hypothetical protein